MKYLINLHVKVEVEADNLEQAKELGLEKVIKSELDYFSVHNIKFPMNGDLISDRLSSERYSGKLN